MNDSTVKKFYVSKYREEIQEREVFRETDSSVWVKSVWAKNGYSQKLHRRSKVTTTDRYCDSWEEAHAYLLDRAEKQVSYYKGQLQKARSSLGQIKSMKPLN